MIPADIQALALADAVGALDPDERLDLEARLADLPPSVRAEVAHLYDASVKIGGQRDRRGAVARRPGRPARDDGTPATHTITAAEGDWVDTGVPGIRVKILAIDRPRNRVTMCSGVSRGPATLPIGTPARKSVM